MANMDAETTAKPARPRLNPFTKAERRERIFAWRRLGWAYADIAREEGLSEQRVQQIASEALKRQSIEEPRDHALLQLLRLEGAQAVAAEAVASGELKAIASFINVLERIDRYQKAGRTKTVYDAAARERLFAKMNRNLARLKAGEARKAAKPAPAAPPPAAADAGAIQTPTPTHDRDGQPTSCL
jgi:hypothetical protein